MGMSTVAKGGSNSELPGGGGGTYPALFAGPARRLLCGFPFRPQLLKNALQRAVEKGQLEQITGKGASGTFQVGKGGFPGNWGWARPSTDVGGGGVSLFPSHLLSPESLIPPPYVHQLKKSGEKPLLGGSLMEDAILSAIAAMNEPKTCSTTALKKYVLEKHPGTNSSLQGRTSGSATGERHSATAAPQVAGASRAPTPGEPSTTLRPYPKRQSVCPPAF